MEVSARHFVRRACECVDLCVLVPVDVHVLCVLSTTTRTYPPLAPGRLRCQQLRLVLCWGLVQQQKHHEKHNNVLHTSAITDHDYNDTPHCHSNSNWLHVAVRTHTVPAPLVLQPAHTSLDSRSQHRIYDYATVTVSGPVSPRYESAPRPPALPAPVLPDLLCSRRSPPPPGPVPAQPAAVSNTPSRRHPAGLGR